MKIAVASEDGVSISQHFGRSACWVVFEVRDGRIVGREVRANSRTHHESGNCHADGRHTGAHNHSAIVAALRDCEAVLSAGMGWRAARELAQNRIMPFIVDPECSLEDAVHRCLAGELAAAEEHFCRGKSE